jgi:hypothetical protein
MRRSGSFLFAKYFILVIILFGMLVITGCPKPKDPLIGEWAVVGDSRPSNSSVATVFKFNPDFTLTVYENTPVGSTIEYQIDSSWNPIRIGWKGSLGIMRFLDNNTLEMGFNNDQNVPNSNNFGSIYRTEPATRPVSFEQSSFHFILHRLAEQER